MHKYFTQTIPITRHNYTIDAIPPVNPSLGRGKGKMGEIVRKKSKAGHVRTLKNGPAGERGPFSKYSRSWPGRRCYAGLHTLTRSWFEEARVRDYISKIDCARTRS